MVDFVANYDIQSFLELTNNLNNYIYSENLYGVNGGFIYCKPCVSSNTAEESTPDIVVYDSDGSDCDDDEDKSLKRKCDKCKCFLSSPNALMIKVLKTHILSIKTKLIEKKKIPLWFNQKGIAVSYCLDDYCSRFIMNYFPHSWLEKGLQ